MRKYTKKEMRMMVERIRIRIEMAEEHDGVHGVLKDLKSAGDMLEFLISEREGDENA